MNPVQDNSEVLVIAVRGHAQINLFSFPFPKAPLQGISAHIQKTNLLQQNCCTQGSTRESSPYSLDQEIPELLLHDLQPTQ